MTPHLKSPSAERCLHRRPCVPPDGQEEHYVHYDEHRRIDGATGRVLVGHLGLDYECQEVREKYHQAPLDLRYDSEERLKNGRRATMVEESTTGRRRGVGTRQLI